MGNYIGPDTGTQRDTQVRTTISSSEGQTSFNIVYTPGYIDVYQNGVRLQVGVDVVANNGTSVVLAVPASLGDIIDLVGVKSSNPWDFYTKAQADIKNGNFYGVATGTGDAMFVTTTTAIAALADGLEIKLRVPGSNLTTTPTIVVTVNGTGYIKNINKFGGQALQIGEWVTNQEITLRYNITSDKLEFIQSLSNSNVLGTRGYQKLPGGLILQWGIDTPTTTGAVLTFPTPFTSAVYSITTGILNNSETRLFTSGLSTTGFTFQSVIGSVSPHYWMAIGK